MDPPITLSDPTRPPVPVAGCGACAALDEQRAKAEATGDIRRATKCEDQVGRHPHGVRS